MRRFLQLILAGVAIGTFWLADPSAGSAQEGNITLNRYYYYPYYYFPHNYWPAQSPKWPEPVGSPYMPPPAYMSFPAFHEPHWRYELWESRKYYRGFHFWLDQF